MNTDECDPRRDLVLGEQDVGRNRSTAEEAKRDQSPDHTVFVPCIMGLTSRYFWWILGGFCALSLEIKKLREFFGNFFC